MNRIRRRRRLFNGRVRPGVYRVGVDVNYTGIVCLLIRRVYTERGRVSAWTDERTDEDGRDAGETTDDGRQCDALLLERARTKELTYERTK